MMQTYPSGRPRVHISTPEHTVKSAIAEYREKIDDGTIAEADGPWFEELILDLNSELSMRANPQSKRRKMKVHKAWFWATDHRGETPTTCGLLLNDKERLTTDRTKITCGNCRRILYLDTEAKEK